MRGFARSLVVQYWLILLAIGIALAGASYAAYLYGLPPFPQPGHVPFRAKNDFEESLHNWAAALILLGPLPVFWHQFWKVRNEGRGVLAAASQCVLASIASNAIALAGVLAGISAAATVNLSLFSGDAGFAILGLYAINMVLPVIVAVFALFAFLLARSAYHRQVRSDWATAAATCSAEAKMPCPYCRERIIAASRECWRCRRLLVGS